MIDWIELHPDTIALAALFSVVTLVASALLLPWVVARMPEDYFVAQQGGQLGEAHPGMRLLYHGLKNVAGGLLLLAGIAMLVLPGQGLLTILAALSLLDFPGKRRLELSLASQRTVRRAITWLRRRAGRPPLRYPGEEPSPTPEG